MDGLEDTSFLLNQKSNWEWIRLPHDNKSQCGARIKVGLGLGFRVHNSHFTCQSFYTCMAYMYTFMKYIYTMLSRIVFCCVDVNHYSLSLEIMVYIKMKVLHLTLFIHEYNFSKQQC
jgi:hypothetical protein